MKYFYVWTETIYFTGPLSHVEVKLVLKSESIEANFRFVPHWPFCYGLESTRLQTGSSFCYQLSSKRGVKFIEVRNKEKERFQRETEVQ